MLAVLAGSVKLNGAAHLSFKMQAYWVVACDFGILRMCTFLYI